MPVDDCLRQPGRAGGEQHVEGVVEGDRVECERPRLGEELGPGGRPGHHILRPARVRNVDDVLERRQPCPDGGDLFPTVDVPVTPAVPGDGEQDLGLELTEPVEDAPRPELGRARCPDRAEARGGEERDERLGDVRQVRDDPVAPTDAEPLEAGTRARHLVAQVAEGQLEGLPRLRAREDRDRVDVLLASQGMLRVVQLRPREPHGARHRVGGEHPFVRRRRLDLEEIPERPPEALEVGDRPLVELGIPRKGEAALGLEPGEVPADLGPLARVRRRGPEHVALGRCGAPRGHDSPSRAVWSRPRKVFAQALVPASALSLTTTGSSSIDSSSP